MRRLVAGALLTLALVGFPTAAGADAPDPVVPPAVTQPADTTLAETGAGDRALIGLGVVGGVLLVGAGAIMAVVTGRSRPNS